MCPSFLSVGDRVSLVAPAGKIFSDELNVSRELLQSWGLQPEFGQCVLQQYGCFAGTMEQRLSDLQYALNDPTTKAIFCARGGYGLMQIVEHLDFTQFKRHPKWLIGYSDITVLHNVATANSIASIHGPMLRNLARKELSEALLKRYRNLLFGDLPIYRIEFHEFNREGEVNAQLVGGNLTVFSALQGTCLELDLTNKILFIEDIGEQPHRIDRILRSLRLSGKLSSLAGLIVGQFSDYEEDLSMHQTVFEMIADTVKDYHFPLAFNFPSGHIPENHPLLFNYNCRFTVKNDYVELDFTI